MSALCKGSQVVPLHIFLGVLLRFNISLDVIRKREDNLHISAIQVPQQRKAYRILGNIRSNQRSEFFHIQRADQCRHKSRVYRDLEVQNSLLLTARAYEAHYPKLLWVVPTTRNIRPFFTFPLKLSSKFLLLAIKWHNAHGRCLRVTIF